METLNDDIRVFKHDFANMVNVISGYIKADDMDGLKKYFSSFEKDYSNYHNKEILNPKIINDPGIYNLLVAKYEKAYELGIIINFEVFFDFKKLQMPIYDFSKILGILLDNAIEATNTCDKKQINLVFNEFKRQNVQIISVENTYSDANLDLSKIFEKGTSGKSNHSGIGLWEVNRLVERNKNCILKTTNDNNYFKQELQIYYK